MKTIRTEKQIKTYEFNTFRETVAGNVGANSYKDDALLVVEPPDEKGKTLLRLELKQPILKYDTFKSLTHILHEKPKDGIYGDRRVDHNNVEYMYFRGENSKFIVRGKLYFNGNSKRMIINLFEIMKERMETCYCCGHIIHNDDKLYKIRGTIEVINGNRLINTIGKDFTTGTDGKSKKLIKNKNIPKVTACYSCMIDKLK